MTIEVLFPEICSLFGDLSNMKYLLKCVPEAKRIDTGLKTEPSFLSEPVDMIYMGGMTERSQELVIAALMPYKQQLAERIDQGTIFLITGNALEVFGQYIEQEDGSRIEGLGLFNLWAKRQMMKRYNSLYLGRFEDMRIVGFKSQFSHSYGDNSQMYLFNTERGDGLHPGISAEGIRKNNFMATYLLGPLLVLNPPFTRRLLKLLGVQTPVLAFEAAAEASYRVRLEEFLNPKTKMQY